MGFVSVCDDKASTRKTCQWHRHNVFRFSRLDGNLYPEKTSICNERELAYILDAASTFHFDDDYNDWYASTLNGTIIRRSIGLAAFKDFR